MEKKFNLRKYWVLYRPFLQFIGSFFLVYVILTLVYQSYINRFDAPQVDNITKLVASHTQIVLHLLEKDSEVYFNTAYGIVVRIHKTNAVRIVEGCNAVSVIILFVSFVIAFAVRMKITLPFILLGGLLIYLLNIVRIAVLSLLLYHYPEQNHLLHGVLFPLIIYGVVFVLWMIWVTIYSKYVGSNKKA